MKNTTQESSDFVTSFELKINPELLVKAQARCSRLRNEIHSYIQQLLELDLSRDPDYLPHAAEMIVSQMAAGHMSKQECLRRIICAFSRNIPTIGMAAVPSESTPQEIVMSDMIRHIDELPKLRTLLTRLQKAGRLEGVATIHPDGRVDLMIHQNPKRSYRRNRKSTSETPTKSALKV